jgi:predicted DNA-binding transcriptional regulator AlpA
MTEAAEIMRETDPIIKRGDLQKLLGVHTDTVRRAIKEKRLPPYDVELSRKTAGWKRSTLLAAGVNV